MPERLKSETCIECQEPIKVAEYTPHPLEDKATGMAANAYDGPDDYNGHFVGWICNRCAWSLAMEKGGRGLIAGGGGCSPSFSYLRRSA